jgi:hypothetical protein
MLFIVQLPKDVNSLTQYKEKMNKEKIINQCLSMIDGFDGSDSDYLDLLHELMDECETRIEGKEMELE